jgi:effector-binding domain-containing protein
MSERTRLHGSLFRFNPKTKVFEALSSGTVNPWGQDWDKYGEHFFDSTIVGHFWYEMPGAKFVSSSAEPNLKAYELIDQIADHRFAGGSNPSTIIVPAPAGRGARARAFGARGGPVSGTPSARGEAPANGPRAPAAEATPAPPAVPAAPATPPSAAQEPSPPPPVQMRPPAAAARTTLVPGPGDPSNAEDVTLPAKAAAILSGTGTWDEGFASLKNAFRTIEEELARAGIAPAGRPVAVFVQTDDMGFRYDAMVPVEPGLESHAPLSREVRFGTTPSGKALRFVHKGAYDEIDETYETITAYLDAKNITAKDIFIEEYVTDLTDSTDTDLEINIFVQPKE